MIMMSMGTVFSNGLRRTAASVGEFYNVLFYLWQQFLVNRSVFGCNLTIMSAFMK